MPELPEVETVRRSLLQVLPQKKIEAVEIITPGILALGDAAAFGALAGSEITDIGRRGKYLMLHFGGGRMCVVHLRMTGKLLYHGQAEPLQKHDHVRFGFADGSELVYNDTRRFGRFWLCPEGDISQVSGLATLGAEPLDDDFSVDYWQRQTARRRNARIKAVLLDQQVVAGLGNIYADEVLFRAGVHPERRTGSLTEEENVRLAAAMRDILQDAISKRGTTFRDYVDGNNQRGSYQEHLQVFQKAGQQCPRCGATIERIRVAGRSSCFCPQCQQPE